jgi:hypothetical protein
VPALRPAPGRAPPDVILIVFDCFSKHRHGGDYNGQSPERNFGVFLLGRLFYFTGRSIKRMGGSPCQRLKKEIRKKRNRRRTRTRAGQAVLQPVREKGLRLRKIIENPKV